MQKLIQWWVTPKLPKQHYVGKNNFSDLLKTWFFHPVKRRIAKIYLIILRKFFGLKVIGITGSAGKTTTKEMLASVLKRKYKTVWSKDNIDPVFNIPTTILRCLPGTKYLILEMGVEYFGEMDYYLWLAKPDVGIITNIFPTHLLYLKNIKGVAKEKGKLVKNLNKSSVAVLNSDNKFSKQLSKDVKAKILWFNPTGDPETSNKKAVEVLCKYLGVEDDSVEKGLEKYSKQKNRLNLYKHKSGAFIFDDTYNSNPEALISTLKVFMEKAGKNKKVVVLGDMLELGEKEVEFHKKMGRELEKLKIYKVIGVGKLSKYFGGKNYSTWQNALPEVKKYLKPKTYILLKGSRSIGLDNLVDRL